MCQGLGDEQIGFGELAGRVPNNRAHQHDAGGPHWTACTDEARPDRGRHELRSLLSCPPDVCERDRLAADVAVHARAFVGL
jgi:hypothetical protein